jgi:hypothetical protein
MILIEKVGLDVLAPPRAPGAERFGAITRLAAGIGEGLPCLSVTLLGA